MGVVRKVRGEKKKINTTRRARSENFTIWREEPAREVKESSRVTGCRLQSVRDKHSSFDSVERWKVQSDCRFESKRRLSSCKLFQMCPAELRCADNEPIVIGCCRI